MLILLPGQDSRVRAIVSPEWMFMISGFHVIKSRQIGRCYDDIILLRRAGSSLSPVRTVISDNKNNTQLLDLARLLEIMSLARRYDHHIDTAKS